MNYEEVRVLRSKGRIINRMRRAGDKIIIRNRRAMNNETAKCITISFIVICILEKG